MVRETDRLGMVKGVVDLARQKANRRVGTVRCLLAMPSAATGIRAGRRLTRSIDGYGPNDGGV
jgi:hypothetical protein